MPANLAVGFFATGRLFHSVWEHHVSLLYHYRFVAHVCDRGLQIASPSVSFEEKISTYIERCIDSSVLYARFPMMVYTYDNQNIGRCTGSAELFLFT